MLSAGGANRLLEPRVSGSFDATKYFRKLYHGPKGSAALSHIYFIRPRRWVNTWSVDKDRGMDLFLSPRSNRFCLSNHHDFFSLPFDVIILLFAKNRDIGGIYVDLRVGFVPIPEYYSHNCVVHIPKSADPPRWKHASVNPN